MKRSWILIFGAALAYGQAVVVRTSTLLDGKGHVLKNTDLAIEGGRIARIGAAKGKAAIDLTGMTVMPGWIDTHIHATWYFNRDGRLEQQMRTGTMALLNVWINSCACASCTVAASVPGTVLSR